MRKYMMVHHPTCMDENQYINFEAENDDKADTKAWGMVGKMDMGMEFDLYSEVPVRGLDATLAIEAMAHLHNNKQVEIKFHTGEIVQVAASGDAGLACLANILVGDDHDLITEINLLDKPTEAPKPNLYMMLGSDKVVDTFMAASDEDAFTHCEDTYPDEYSNCILTRVC